MNARETGRNQEEPLTAPLSAGEDREHRHHRTHASSSHHRHGRSRSQSRSRHHHHHHHHHRHHRHGHVRGEEDLAEADRQMLRSPQTARPTLTDLQSPINDSSRGPSTAPMDEGGDNNLRIPRAFLARPNVTPQLSRTVTPAPTYRSNAPSETEDYVKKTLPSTPGVSYMQHSQSFPPSMAKPSPRTLAYVEEQRIRAVQQPIPAQMGPSDLPNRVHFVPSSAASPSTRVASTIQATPNENQHHHHTSSRHLHHQQQQQQYRDSRSTMHDELNNRDQRFSHMVENCFRDSAQYLQAFSKRTTNESGDLRNRQKKRTSMVDSIMGFDEMRPQDLVYGEGSKVDGGFGFALPSRYREGTVLLDSGPARLSIDSSPITDSETETQSSTGSYSSRLSSLFGGNRNSKQAQQQQQQQPSKYRESKDSRANSFLNRRAKPTSLADRVTSANLRPAPLSFNQKSMTGKPMTPSRLRESTSVSDPNSSEKTWEEVRLDTDGQSRNRSSKNDRLAEALGVKRTESEMSRDSSSESTIVGDDDSSSSAANEKHFNSHNQREDDTGRISKYQGNYKKRDDQGRRSSVNMPQGMSQADIVAICLVQGMVPPGLPPDPTLVTWSTPLSPTNPRNWSPFHKWYACILVSAATFLANAGTNMLAPALGLISKTYYEIYTPAIRGLLIGCYVLAFAFAPLIFGPMSEVMGRKPVLLIGCAFFFVFTLASGFVNTSYLMMFFRFLTALGASAPMSIGGAVITDIFPPEQRGSAMTVFALAPQLGPVLGPMMGGWVTQEIEKWRWIFYIKAIAIAIVCFPMLFIRESYTPRILANRADRLRKDTGNAALSTIFERRKESIAQIFTRGSIRPLVLFASEPIIQMIAVYVSVIYGVIHLLVATFPAVMGTVYAEYPGWASMHFIGIGVGTITGGIAGGFLTEFHYKRLTKRNGGIARPEFKLFSLLYITWLAPLGLAGYFFITYWGVHWIFADVFIVLFCFGISAAVVSLQSYIVDCFSLLAGSALTSTIVIRSFFGFGATVGAEDLLLRGGLFWSGVSLSTVCTVICVPIVFIVYYRGAHMRSKSKYATHKR